MATTTTSIRGNYRSYSVEQKKRAIAMAAEQGLASTSRILKIPATTIKTWDTKYASTPVVKKKKPGQPARFLEEEKMISSWVLVKRDQHLPVSRQAIKDYAKKTINRPDFNASNGWLDRFLKRNGLGMRCKTSTASQLPDDLQERMDIFLRHVKELRGIHDFDPDCIVNMDETPVFFDLVPQRTIAKKGSKDVVVRSTGAQKQRVTCVLAVTSSGKPLPPMVICKGVRLPKDLTVPDGVFIQMHPKGWMTQDIMCSWLETILRPYTQRRPCLLVMDSFSGHCTDKVKTSMAKINVTPAVIPGGCTSKIQPLDVSINKPFKAHQRTLWTSYMHRSVEEGLEPKPAPRSLLLQWIDNAWEQIAENSAMIRKSFVVTGITGALTSAEEEAAEDNRKLLDILTEDDDSTPFLGFTADDIPQLELSQDPFLH